MKSVLPFNCIRTAVMVVTALATVAPGQTPSWVRLTEEAAFSPRDTAEDAIFNGKLWLSNGYYHGNVLHRDLWNSTDSVNWTQVSDATPYDGYSELVVFQKALWAIKGSVWRSEDGATWTQVLAETPFGVRGYGEAVVFQEAIWQLGSGPDVWRTRDGKDWERVVEAAPYGDRSAAAVTVFQNKLWLLGGRTPGASDPPEKGYPKTTTHNDVWCSEDGISWVHVLEHAPWTPRQWFPVFAYRDHLWVLGGYDNVNNTNLGDVWYSRDGKKWSPYEASETFAPRHEPTIYVHDGQLLVVAGNTWPVVNDVWSLTLPEGWSAE